MSVRFDKSGDLLRRTTGMPTNVRTWSMCGWCRIISDRVGQWRFFAGLEDSLSNATGYQTLGWTAGNSYETANSNGSRVTLPSPPLDQQWFFWTLAFSQSTAPDGATHRLCWGLPQQDLLTNSTGGAYSTYTPLKWAVGSNSYDEWVDCEMSAVKIWDRYLTLAEFERERFSYVPQNREALISFNPFIDDLEDYGPNQLAFEGLGYSFSVNEPPIEWDIGRDIWTVEDTFRAAWRKPEPPPQEFTPGIFESPILSSRIIRGVK